MDEKVKINLKMMFIIPWHNLTKPSLIVIFLTALSSLDGCRGTDSSNVQVYLIKNAFFFFSRSKTQSEK